MSSSGGFGSYMPILFSGFGNLAFLFFNILIARRKGKSPLKYGLLSLIPFSGIYFTAYLLSFSDKQIKDRIEAVIKGL